MSPASHLPRSHFLLAIAVMAVWGSNFVVIKLALEHLPPLLLAALRFTCAFLPAVFFLKRPTVAWTNLAAYGVLIGAGQFGLLFLACMHRGCGVSVQYSIKDPVLAWVGSPHQQFLAFAVALINGVGDGGGGLEYLRGV